MKDYISETERIKKAYGKRTDTVPSDLYSFFNDAYLYSVQSRDRAILQVLKSNNITNITKNKILDIGCGAGGELRNLIRYGATPDNLYGIDLLDYRIEAARSISPNMHFECTDASIIPYESEYFDLLFQFTVFTSILDANMKISIAGEMMRVLKPDGIIVWYDYYMDNPSNPDVKGVKKGEIESLFPGCYINLKSITLAPPLARMIAPHSIIICELIEKIRLLNTHYIGIIKRIAK